VCPSIKGTLKDARRKLKKKQEKNVPNCIPFDVFDRRNIDPSVEVQPP